MTEEIITALASVDQLKVISRTSSFFFKGQNIPISEIASQLDVSVVLEGSVRIGGDTLRVSAQLINVEDDSHFWSESWDRKMDNLFEVQDEISVLIAEKLREHVGHMNISDHLVKSPTKNLDAYEHYLKGRFHLNKWNPEDINKAIDQFELALKQDNQLIEAHLGLADGYSFLAVAGFAPREASWLKAMESMNVARELDSEHAGLNYMLANQAFFTEANYSEAMVYALKSVKSRPNYPEAQQYLSFLFGIRGDMEKSKEHLMFAKSIDPLNPETRFYEAYYLYRTREFEQAKSILVGLLNQNDKNLPALFVYLYIAIKTGAYSEAKEKLGQIPDQLMAPDERLGIACLIAQASGDPDETSLQKLQEYGEDPSAHRAHSYLFLNYVERNDYDAAFDILDKVFSSKSSVLLLTFTDPLADMIRQDKRWQDYHQKIYAIQTRVNEPVNKVPSVPDEQVGKEFLERLQSFMEKEKPYLDPTLSLRSLAEQIEVHPNQLSWLINEFVGQNFNEYINRKRVEHFKQLVVDPSNSHISLVGLGFESGFNSKTVFNTAFKKITGLTPKAYQKSQS
ncbi:MAG: adenylate cyclase [Flammeovirgaceae bacterium]|nr:adenylate cyclase [Flammeovirgaceae bacterium]MBR10584.1 adenylate cyclase [Rickettsiales bacterium]HCX23379.1 adenylate cyclase [Cytophagales bacterium]